jgi:disulfide bond formation protein DsbB
MILTTRGFAGFVLIASSLVLGAALMSQYWGGLAPCELCLLQRWPWSAAIAFAFYHVGVEQHWFAGPSACTASATGAMTLDEMKRQILGTAPVLCDRVQWALFGVSMAGWNLVASLGMEAICAVVFARTRRVRSPATATA